MAGQTQRHPAATVHVLGIQLNPLGFGPITISNSNSYHVANASHVLCSIQFYPPKYPMRELLFSQKTEIKGGEETLLTV